VTSVVWGCALTLLTEFLSFFALLNRPAVAAGWTVFAIASGVLLLRAGAIPKASEALRPSGIDKFIVTAIAGILACTFVISVISPPNSNDSMTYHMSRVMHWIQQGSVVHYPTNVLRQLELNPWAEFAILHLQILSDGDYLANLVQWYSMAGCIVGVSLIAGLFDISIRGQLLSSLVAATLPMAILQSSSTQNDLVVSFWLICFVLFGHMSMREKSLKWILLMSLSLGLAILTKGTAYIYAFPFVVWFIAVDIKRSWQLTSLKYMVLAGTILALNFGHFNRNYKLFNNPLHSGSDPYSNSYITPRVVLSNLSRNIALHLMTPSFTLNSHITGAVNSFHSLVGISVDDPATTWPDASFNEKRNRLSPSEDNSGNPLHLYVFMAAMVPIFIRKRFRRYLPYVLATLASFLLFCTMLRWQPWASRLHLPMFMLFSPIAGAVISEINRRWSVYVLAIVLSFAALPWVMFNQARPLITLYPLISNFYPNSIFTAPRRSLYFVRNRGSEKSFLDTTEKIRAAGSRNIALKGVSNGYEYPLWALTRRNGLNGPRIVYVDVQNISKNIPQSPYYPDIVVVLVNRNDTCEASIEN
jgi:4-amino-4-deoxy-L-arabinose transferase-like glycosyltransferase